MSSGKRGCKSNPIPAPIVVPSAVSAIARQSGTRRISVNAAIGASTNPTTPPNSTPAKEISEDHRAAPAKSPISEANNPPSTPPTTAPAAARPTVTATIRRTLDLHANYFFAVSKSFTYSPYPSCASFETGMKRMDAEFMQ